MIRVCIVCEGQTEVEFVKSCLAPYLRQSQVLAFPSLLFSLPREITGVGASQ